MEGTKFYMWQNRMCISYLLRFNQMKRFLELNGWVAIADICEADYCIIGACGAFLSDFDRYRNKVAEVTDLKKSKLVIFGCLPVIDKNFYKDTTPEDTLFIHSRRPEQIEKLVGEIKVPWSEVELNGRFRDVDYVHNIPQRSYVLIPEGCNEGCVYCPHWLSIGRERSRPLAEIVEEVSQAYARGDREFVLEGNNAGSWGLDFKPPASYPEMLEGWPPRERAGLSSAISLPNGCWNTAKPSCTHASMTSRFPFRPPAPGCWSDLAAPPK